MSDTPRDLSSGRAGLLVPPPAPGQAPSRRWTLIHALDLLAMTQAPSGPIGNSTLDLLRWNRPARLTGEQLQSWIHGDPEVDALDPSRTYELGVDDSLVVAT